MAIFQAIESAALRLDIRRLPVAKLLRVRLDATDRTFPPLRAGMSVEVDVDTGHARGFPSFLRSLFGHRGS